MALSETGWFYRKLDDFIGNQMIFSRKFDFNRKINWNQLGLDVSVRVILHVMMAVYLQEPRMWRSKKGKTNKRFK